MKTLLASTCLAFALSLGASASLAADCGSPTIASMNWQSAEVLSEIDKIILNTGYGCNAEITIGDTVPTITSMVEKGQPDIAPEAWADNLPDVVKRGVDEGKLVVGATALTDGGVQGWWIPKYIAEANPEIKTFGDLLKNPKLFPDAENPDKGAIVNGPQGWGGTVVTAQMFKAFGFEQAGFNLIDSGSAAGLDGSIAKAYERKQPWVGFYWAPTALLGKYEMVRLELGVPADEAEWKRCNTVANCPDPKPNAWPADKVVTLVAAPFANKAGPDIMAYLNKRAWGNDTVNKLMAWMTDNQATGADSAKYFLKENPDVWTPWVSEEAAQKIKAAL